MGDQRQITDEQLKEGLENLVFLVRALSGHCESTQDLIGMAELALTNDGQFKLLMSVVKSQGIRR